MSPPLRRLLRVGIAAVVAVLVFVCVALVHHEGGTAEPHEMAHLTPSGLAIGGHGTTAPDQANGEHCALAGLVACARTSPSAPVGFVLPALGALIAFLAVARPARPVRRSSPWCAGVVLPQLTEAPSLSALCVSRT